MGEQNRETPEQLLESRVWQKAPGGGDIDIFPVIRKPDAICSNCFILRSPQCLVVIDPGADRAQTDVVFKVLTEQLRERPRPIVILFTHCHRDHSWHGASLAAQLEEANAQVVVLAHEAGARALAARDTGLTLAYMFKEEVPQFGPIDSLLGEPEIAAGAAREISRNDGFALELRPETAALENGENIVGQSLSIGGGARLSIFHAPGHSGDSVVMSLGQIVFMGDLPFAANPGVAGIVGWDQAALMKSLDQIGRMIRSIKGAICCPGHGFVMPGGKALKIFEGARARAAELGGAALLDADRARYLKDYAGAILEEASELFTRLGGKLYSLSYRMEQLEEPEEAQRILDALDVASIDNYLTDFQNFARNFDCSTLDMALPLKGFQVFGRIESVLSGGKLAGLIDASLLRRARRLLADFVNAMQGLPPKDFCKAEDVNFILLETLSEFHERGELGQEILNSLEDPQAFARALTERIARQNIIARAIPRLDAEAGLPKVLVDRDYLADCATGIMERLAVRGAEQIVLRTNFDASAQRVKIQISAPPLSGLESILGERKIRLIRATLQPYAAALEFPAASPESIAISFPSAWIV